MHTTFADAFIRSSRRLETAARAAAGEPAARAAWSELADAAREIEADCLLAGEYRLAYVATKIDCAVTGLPDQPWPPPIERRQEVRDLIAAFDAARVDWQHRQSLERTERGGS